MRLNTVDNNVKYKSQLKLAFINFLSEFTNLIFEAATAFMSCSILVWADCFASFESTTHAFVVFLASFIMKRESGEKYNFGVERLEVITSFICDLIITLGYIILIATAVYQIINIKKPSGIIWTFLVIKTFNLTWDGVFVYKQRKILKENPSRLNESLLARARDNLTNDILAFVLVFLCFALKGYKWAWYIAPVATIIISLLFIYQCIIRIRHSFSELTDVSTTPENQDMIFDVLLKHAHSFDSINEVNCRYLNKRLYVDIDVAFKDNFTYENQKKLLSEIDSGIKEKNENSLVRFVIQNK